MTTTKITGQAKAITHGSVFHADDVLATVILSKVIDDLTVCRSFKVPDNLAENVVVYDIGFGKYDHHQKGGNGERENGVPYASCGLLWKKIGMTIVSKTLNPELVWKLVDRDLIQGIDAIDNGKMPATDYPAQAMTFSNVISSFNPTWDSNEDPDEKFIKAVAFAETVFDNVLASAISKAKAQMIVDEAIENAEGHVMVLERFAPWQDAIFSSTNEKAADIQFVVFPSNRGGFNWQCVPDALGSRNNRKNVPAEWKGLQGPELQAVTGVKTASFCHQAGFIGGADTLEDAIKLAKMASEAD